MSPPGRKTLAERDERNAKRAPSAAPMRSFCSHELTGSWLSASASCPDSIIWLLVATTALASAFAVQGQTTCGCKAIRTPPAVAVNVQPARLYPTQRVGSASARGATSLDAAARAQCATIYRRVHRATPALLIHVHVSVCDLCGDGYHAAGVTRLPLATTRVRPRWCVCVARLGTAVGYPPHSQATRPMYRLQLYRRGEGTP